MIKRVDRADGFRYQVYAKRNGRKVYIGTYAGKRDAIAAEEDDRVTQRKIESGELAAETDTKRTLEKALDEWLTSLEKRGSRSHESYSNSVKLYIKPQLGALAIANVSTTKLMEWRDKLATQHAPATVNGARGCLSSAFTYFVKRQWINRNPVQGVEKIERPDGIYCWIETREEITKLLLQCPGDVRDIVAVALGTGMRLDELLFLQWADIDLERRLITVHRGRQGTVKSGKARRVPILDAILPMLRARSLKRGGAVLVFPGPKGKARSKPGVRDAYKLAVKRTGLDKRLRFHDLRHTFASHWILDGGDIFSLAKVLGHHSVTVTEKFYAHLRPDHWDKDYGRVAFIVPAEAPVYEFKRGPGGQITDRVLVAM